MTPVLKVWGRPTSTNTQRVLWTLVEAGVPYELTLASGTTGEKGYVWQGEVPFGIVDNASYLSMNPNGTIPTIDDGGFILWESNAIVAYLARRYAASRLFGADETMFARALQWMIWANYSMDPALHALILHLERLPASQRSAETVEVSRREVVRRLELMEARLALSTYFAGDVFTIGDIPLGISTQRFFHFELERPDLPHVEGWLARLGEREGFRVHVAPLEKHLPSRVGTRAA
jgi:glutathione S-transferase